MVEIKIPSPGESITEVEITSWFVKDGDYVERDQEVAEVESDKATLPLIAPEAGAIKITGETGKPIKVGTVVATIDEKAKAPDKPIVEAKTEKKVNTAAAKATHIETKTVEPEKKVETPAKSAKERDEYTKVKISPVAREKMKDYSLNIEDVINGLRRISSDDIERVAKDNTPNKAGIPSRTAGSKERKEDVVRMSSLRRKLSKRLVFVKNETAMLTTFNEVDMSAIINMRAKYQQSFTIKHEIKLGFMSFFTKAVTESLLIYPKVNSLIDDESIVTPNYVDVGIAVQTDKGLMVPIIRNAETLNLGEIELKIAELALKARNFSLSIEEMTGGTFTITNGGIFGSLLSTPILNPPQAAILGMHNIVDRPVAINNKVEIRPMMYLALSYDHRIIDGKDSVTFLMKVKELLESPYKMVLGGIDPEKLLMGL